MYINLNKPYSVFDFVFSGIIGDGFTIKKCAYGSQELQMWNLQSKLTSMNVDLTFALTQRSGIQSVRFGPVDLYTGKKYVASLVHLKVTLSCVYCRTTLFSTMSWQRKGQPCLQQHKTLDEKKIWVRLFPVIQFYLIFLLQQPMIPLLFSMQYLISSGTSLVLTHIFPVGWD